MDIDIRILGYLISIHPDKEESRKFCIFKKKKSKIIEPFTSHEKEEAINQFFK